MLHAYARFRLPDDTTVDLCPGDIIGRLWSAALRLDDARISEAHALVSLRGGDLKLLALRGMLAVRQLTVSEVTLKPGVEIQMAEGFSLAVVAVELPETALAIEGLGHRPQRLTGSVYSVLLDPRPLLASRYLPEAAAHLWSTGEGWRIRVGQGPPEAVEAGGEWMIGGRTITAVELPIEVVGQPTTIIRGQLFPPLRIVANYETAHIHREGEPTLSISGTPAQILSELAAFKKPVPWEVAAGEIWRDVDDRDVLRVRWDRNLATLRRKLREGRIRPDLVRASGKGDIELLLLPGDELAEEG